MRCVLPPLSQWGAGVRYYHNLSTPAVLRHVTSLVALYPLALLLQIEPLQNWLEGSFGIHNVTVDSCIFNGTRSSPVHTFGATDVFQTNNTFIS